MNTAATHTPNHLGRQKRNSRCLSWNLSALYAANLSSQFVFDLLRPNLSEPFLRHSTGEERRLSCAGRQSSATRPRSQHAPYPSRRFTASMLFFSFSPAWMSDRMLRTAVGSSPSSSERTSCRTVSRKAGTACAGNILLRTIVSGRKRPR